MFKKMIFATGNSGKLKEAVEIFDDMEIVSIKKIDPSFNPEETGDTFLQNVMIKAEAAMDVVLKDIVLADDSGLVVPELDGQPGLYSARFSGEDATDEENRLKLLEMMKNIDDRTAYFCCRAVVMFPDASVISTEGRVYGKIGFKDNGDNGFGYDPIFVPDGFNKTLAELSSEEKNSISHRGDAFRKLKEMMLCLQNCLK